MARRRGLRSPLSYFLALSPTASWTLALATVASSAVVAAGCHPATVLHAPQMAPAARPTGARDAATVELLPIVAKPGAVLPFATDLKPPPPEAVLTSAMQSELRGRALHHAADAEGAGAYEVRCTLDRFAIRTQSDIAATHTLASLFVDLGCEALRESGGQKKAVWRGELRARSAATASSVLSTDTGLLQRMIDRMLSDGSRELASDLAIRALGLYAEPSQRLFADESVQKELAGIDDTPFGPTILAENPSSVAQALEATKAGDATTRAAGWNAAAMAAGPGDPWLAGEKLHLDDEPIVRFFQYKTLARLGTATALGEMRGALAHEGEPLLVELLEDSLASGGIGLARARP